MIDYYGTDKSLFLQEKCFTHTASGLACKIDAKENRQNKGKEGRGICSIFDAVTMWPVRVSTPPI